jgi:hypothetical protein
MHSVLLKHISQLNLVITDVVGNVQSIRGYLLKQANTKTILLHALVHSSAIENTDYSITVMCYTRGGEPAAF